MKTEDFDEKQEAELDAFEQRQMRSFERGKRLVWLIAGVNILFDLINIFVSNDFQIVQFAVHVALSAALVYGVTWVRYLYAVAGILTVIVTILALPGLVSLMQVSAVSGIYIAVLILTVCYSATSAVILLFSKSVKEYMYRKKSERL
ncbi:MAG: hypothetical protein K1W23_20770 [Lachnospiraceae bacterium]